MSSRWAHSIACRVHDDPSVCTCKALDDRIATLRHDLDRERRDLEVGERAEVEGRVADRGLWLATLAGRRQRIAGLQAQLARLEGDDAA